MTIDDALGGRTDMWRQDDVVPVKQRVVLSDRFLVVDVERSRTDLVGFQRRTDAAEIGERSLDVDDDRGDEERPIVEDGVATGTICRCGATDHRDHGDEVRESVAPARLGKQLVEAIETLGLEDKHEVDVLGPAIRAAVESGDSPREAIEEAVILE